MILKMYFKYYNHCNIIINNNIAIFQLNNINDTKNRITYIMIKHRR